AVMDASFVVPGPVNVAGTLSRYRLWGEDPVNRLSDGVFRRAIKWEGRWRGYELRWSDDAHAPRLTVSVPGARRAALVDAAVAEARHVCGLDLDLAPFYVAVAGDAVLGGLTTRLRGLRPTLSPGAFEMLVGSVCAQQVNLTFAFTVRARLVRRFGEPLLIGGEAGYSFPGPSALAPARRDELRRMQLTTRKAEYIVGLARHIVTGTLDLDGLRRLCNDAASARLTTSPRFGTRGA